MLCYAPADYATITRHAAHLITPQRCCYAFATLAFAAAVVCLLCRYAAADAAAIAITLLLAADV